MSGFLAVAVPIGRERVRWAVLFASAAALTGLVILALLLGVDEPSYGLALALPLVAVFAIAMFTVPVQVIPAALVAVLALVPTRLIPGSGPFNVLPPLALLMGVWVLRRVLLGQRGPRTAIAGPPARLGPRLAVYATSLVLAGWFAVSAVDAGGGETEVGWSLAFVLSALVPLLVFDAREEMTHVRTVLLVVGAIAGANILVEMVLGMSPLYGLFGSARTFEFSVYRAQGAFSHPLFAGAFLAIPALLGIGTWLTSGRRWPLVCGALAAAGVLATVSRGSIAAIGVGVAVAVVVAPFFVGWRHITRWFVLIALSGVGALVVLNFGPLVERSSSIESQLSAGVRERAIQVALDASAYSGWLGTGPGTSGQTGRLFDSIVIENSLLQLLMSIGIPGLVLFLLFAGTLVWCAWARGDLGVGLAVIGYIVAISGFNSLDAVRNMHIVIGFLVLLAVHDSTDPLPRPSPASTAPTRSRALLSA